MFVKPAFSANIHLTEPFNRFAVCCLALGTFYGVGLGNSALALVALLAIAQALPKYRSTTQNAPLVLGLAFVAYVLSLDVILGRPYSTDTARDWALASIIPGLCVAYILRRWPRSGVWVLLFLISGYFLRVGERLDPGQLSAFIEGTQRATFGNSANNFGTWSVVTFFGALTLTILLVNRAKYAATRLLYIAFGVVTCSGALAGLLFSQTRGAWVAFIVASVIAPLFVYLTRNAEKGVHISKRTKIIAPVIAALMVTGGIIASKDLVLDRLSHERETVTHLLEGDFSKIDSGSIGYRYEMTVYGLEAWLERPLLGWGNGASESILSQTPNDGLNNRGFIHFHNMYITMLVEIGLTGLILYLAGIGAIIWKITSIGIIKSEQRWILFFVLTSSLAIAIAGIFSQPLFSYRMPFLMAILCGLAMAINYRSNRAENTKEESL